MSTAWPTIWIFVVSSIVGLGAYVTQRAWHELADARDRQAVVSSLAGSVEVNRRLLANTVATTSQYREPTVLTHPIFPAAETAVLSQGISRGIFIADRFEPLMSQMRATYEALERYNRSSARPMGSPRQVNTDALWAQTENESLASLLAEEYGQEQLRESANGRQDNETPENAMDTGT